MRIRKKITLIVCASCFGIFLFLYLLIGRAIKPEPKSELLYLQSKLSQLEQGLNKHHNEVDAIRKAINGIQHNQISADYKDLLALANDKPRDLIDGGDMKELLIDTNLGSSDRQQCSFRDNVVPQPDIQMLDVYREIPFDNVDGGPWKQGWRVEYDPKEWNRHHKLKVFVVPHSHNDPGWISTFDEYYERSTKLIFANMLRHLDENEGLRFIWAEISYFAKWYDKLAEESQKTVRKLVQRRQLEFVTGGWVMTDEANSHWFSMLQQLTEGQTWLKNAFNITPISSWSIDPFGQSPTMPYILKNSGFENLLIQRTHYSVKKRFAQKKELEFRWRQLWDNDGDTEIFTHMMPFYSYDVPHTCGPDPKICCQFDFKRLPGYGLSCPWRIAPQVIDSNNVAKKAELIVDQWRKKSVLYKTRAVLIPLGDDFRYTQSTEWEAQRINFEKLFEYINNEDNLNVEAKFGTLQDYFDAVRAEKSVDAFPSLSGDFFTYADRDDHYWSGYFTSRPYHKRMDRVLMNYLRSAEMLHAWAGGWPEETGFDVMLQDARRALSLFQHHDGITGTAKEHVMKDYANQMEVAIKGSKFVIQQAAYKLLTKPNIYQPDFNFHYFSIDDSRAPGPDADNRPIIIIGDEIPTKHVVFHNSLPHPRNEIVELYVAKPFVQVMDAEQVTVQSQVSPVWTFHRSPYGPVQPQASTTKYRLLFKVVVPPMGLAVYTLHAKTSAAESLGATFSKVTIFTDTPFSANLGEFPNLVEFAKPRDITLHAGDADTGASFGSTGLLKSVAIDGNSRTVPVHLEFLKYGVRNGRNGQNSQRSGAYLFMPDGPATPLPLGSPNVLVNEGQLQTSIATGLPFAVHETILSGNGALEIRNLIDIGDMGNTEIVMRLATQIRNEETFFTDSNGLQMVKRQRFSKLPLQANYYPVPATIYVEDEGLRLTLLTAQPLGGASLRAGEVEIMQDRRLNQDDDRGLGQGVLDNRPTLNIFRLLIENREACTKLSADYPAGYLSVAAFTAQKTLLHPLEKLIFNENEWTGMLPAFGGDHEPLEVGLEVVVFRELPHIRRGKLRAVGVVLHRNHFEKCTSDVNREGLVNLRKTFQFDENRTIHTTNLTMLQAGRQLQADELSMCPMSTKAFVIHR